jgi:hypothetical protein
MAKTHFIVEISTESELSKELITQLKNELKNKTITTLPPDWVANNPKPVVHSGPVVSPPAKRAVGKRPSRS